MNCISSDLDLQAILGRGGDFVGGIDNEALDFSQLEAFINSDASQANGSYFGESLSATSPTTGKLLNVIVENKRPPHSLPESPPDSSSEHPYSPQENCEPGLNPSDTIYTTLGQPIYKPAILNPIIADNLIIGSHIVVADQNDDATAHLLENGNILDADDLRNMNGRILQESGILLQDGNIIAAAGGTPGATSGGESNQAYVENCPRRTQSDLLLVKNDEYEKSQLVNIGYSHNIEIPIVQRTNLENGICEPALDNMQAVYTNLQNVSKKRKLSQDLPLVKSEPEHCSPSQLSPPSNLTSPLDDDYAASEGCLSESQYQCIRFQPFQQSAWHALCDQNLTELPTPHYRVDADKGFNFSNADDAFVCQKKNHFQITCHVQLLGVPTFVKTTEGFQKISSYHLHFYGVKHDCPTQTIRVEQSQSDRSKKPFHPVLFDCRVELMNSQVTKITVGRLHFSETTSNNMRKKGKPNPEQRYFQLVVGLHAHTTHGNFPVISHASQKIIVRASNPGQFESDVELCWQKGQTQDSVFHAGKVGINTDRPDESLVIHGNLKITGHIIQPSDIRAKKNIVECDTAEQLKNVQKLRVVRYEYEPEFASQLKRLVHVDTGVIAQEVAEILPEAVSPAGDLILENGTSIDNFLVVNKERIFMENIGAVKELCKVTDNLETRIDQLERINRRLNKLKRGDSLKSNSTVSSTKYMHSKKCYKQHACPEEAEFCSTKFIQVIIVVLVLIMAFCLAAITALYLIDASRHQQLSQGNRQFRHNTLNVNYPTKTSKARQTWPTYPKLPPTTPPYKETGITRVANSEVTVVNRQSPHVIGRPPRCTPDYQEYEASNLCQMYCCASSARDGVIGGAMYREKLQKSPLSKNKTPPPLAMDKNRAVKPFNTNNIDKQVRQKRDTDYSDKENSFDNTDDQYVTVMITGKNFSTVLTRDYLLDSNRDTNYSYIVPISRYMPDPYITLVFRSHQGTIGIEHCANNVKKHLCPSAGQEKNRTQVAHNRGVDEGILVVPHNTHRFSFQVDMLDFQVKTVTYRVTLRQNQNACKISASKAGFEFTEYNFNFYRHCDE